MLKTFTKRVTLRVAQTVFSCFTLFIALNTLAYGNPAKNDQLWYQIEYVIFEHLKTDDHILRYEDTPYPVKQTKQYSYLTTDPSPASPFQFTLLDDGSLTAPLKKLQRSRSVKVLDSGAWQQNLSDKFLSAPLRVNKKVSNERNLFGEIQLRKSRYTHAEFKLHLTNSITVPFENISHWFAAENSKWQLIDLITPLSNTSAAAAVGTDTVYTNVIYLNESRRIKDDEIHYIDHPVLSAIITIKEIPNPDISTQYLSYSGE